MFLTWLSLDGNALVDLGPLAGMTALNTLWLNSNAIADLGPLAGLTQLGDLHLDSNAIVDLAPLAGLTQLTYLDLDGNAIVDLGPLAGMSALHHLDLTHNQIVDLGPLASLGALAIANLDRNHIVDVSPLALPMLFEVDLDDNDVVDISPLLGAPVLGSLEVSQNPLGGDLNSLAAHPALFRVEAEDAGLTTIPEFGTAQLESLWLSDNAIVDLAPLGAYQALTIVYLNNNDITQLAPIADDPWLGQCDNVQVYDNPLDDFTLMQTVPQLCAIPVQIEATGVLDCNQCIMRG